MQTQRPRKIKICFIVDKTRVGRDVYYIIIAGFYNDGKAYRYAVRACFEGSPCTTSIQPIYSMAFEKYLIIILVFQCM